MSISGEQPLGMAATTVLRTLRGGAARQAVEEEIALDRIEPNPYQQRRTFDEVKLRELADSLHSDGQLQAVVVRPHPTKPGYYQLVAGERRWRAAQLAGWPTIRCIQRDDVEDTRLMLLAYLENGQRVDLTPVEEAEAFEQMMQLNNWTITEVAKRVGKSRVYIGERLELLSDDAIRGAVQDGLLSFTTAREALRALDAEQRRQLVEEARQGLVPTSERVRHLAAASGPATGRRSPGRRSQRTRGAPAASIEPAVTPSLEPGEASSGPPLPSLAGPVLAAAPDQADGGSTDATGAVPVLGGRAADSTAPGPAEHAPMPAWLMPGAIDLPVLDAAANRRTDYLLQDVIGMIEQLQGLRQRAQQLAEIFGATPNEPDQAIRDQAAQVMRCLAVEAYTLAEEWQEGYPAAPA